MVNLGKYSRFGCHAEFASHALLDALGYRAVLSFQDVREDSLSDRERLLSLLKVYFSSNKEAFGIERLGLFGSEKILCSCFQRSGLRPGFLLKSTALFAFCL